jgi:thiol-disulfide isomerase/thioredoxin
MRTILTLVVALAVSLTPCQGQWRLEGRILDASGIAPRVGHVVLRHPSTRQIIRSARVDANGTFSLSIDSAGVYSATFSAVDHKPSSVILWAFNSAPVHVEARLGLNVCPDSIKDVRVIGSFNRFAVRNAIPMQKGGEGIYALELNSDSSLLAYQLLGTVADRRSVNGQQSAFFELDGHGDYISIVHTDEGKVTLRFDPRIVPNGASAARMEIHSIDPEVERVADIFNLRDSILRRFSGQLDSVRRAGKSTSLFKDEYDWHEAQQPLRARLSRESAPLSRQALLLSLFCSAPMDARDSLLARQLLTEVPAESPFWSISPSGCIENVRASLSARGVEKYVHEVIRRNPDPHVRAEFLLEALMEARFEGVGKGMIPVYFTKLTTEYPGSNAAESARQFLTPSKFVKVGEKLPAFKFRDLRDTNRCVTNATFHGKVFLLDFWATSCRPCVAEMPTIHRAYDKFHPLGLEIVSVSIGDAPADIFAFFQTRDSMPWFNAVLSVSERTSVMEAFELRGVPWPLLVDKHGKIIAMDTDARGENLDEQLRKFFEGKNNE